MKISLFTILTFIALNLVSFAAEKPNVMRVALVFDDGPVIAQTEKMLALLAQEKVHVSFSYMGKNVEANPELAKAASKAGHEIQNHSYTHPHLPTLDEAAILQEVTKTSVAIERATGKPPAWFWAPFLELDDKVVAQVKKAGLTPFPFTQYHFVSSDDWNVQQTDAAAIRKHATTDIKDKTVILFHEWRPETLAELPAILTELRRQGCVFLTFSELAKLTP
jgi:peptidoglycan/xylan/chitin deacetylase (PgdA/CDA1 family)